MQRYYGFRNERDIKDILWLAKQYVGNGRPAHETDSVNEKPYPTDVFIAEPKTVISGASPGTAETSFRVGSGTVYLLQKVTSETQRISDTTGNPVEQSVYNLGPEIPIDFPTLLIVVQDVAGDYWVADKLVLPNSSSSSLSSSSSSGSSSSLSSSSTSSLSSTSSSSSSSSSSSGPCIGNCCWIWSKDIEIFPGQYRPRYWKLADLSQHTFCSAGCGCDPPSYDPGQYAWHEVAVTDCSPQ